MTKKPKPNQSRPEVQVEAKPQRRRFPAKYKISILEQLDACTKPGEISALLRRESLYSSYITAWKSARDQGQLAALQPKKRGRKPKKVDPRDERIAELEKQLTTERTRRKRAEGLVELQKKVAALLEESPQDETP